VCHTVLTSRPLSFRLTVVTDRVLLFLFLLHSNRSQCRHHSGVARNYVYVWYGILAGLILSVQSNQSVQSKMQFVQFKMRNCAVQKHQVEDIIDIK